MQILTMIKKQLKLLFRNRVAILATISVPIILTYLMAFSQNGVIKQKLYVVNNDKGIYSKALVSLLKNHKDIDVISAGKAQTMKALDNQDIYMGVEIDKNFSKNVLSKDSSGIKILENYECSESALLEQAVYGDISALKKVLGDSNYIAAELNQHTIFSRIINDMKKDQNISVTDKSLNQKTVSNYDTTLRLIGFIAMFIWFVIMQGFRTLVDEKENNTYSRLISTPTKYYNYLFSKIAATYVFGAIHVAAILIAASYFLKIKISLQGSGMALVVIFAAYLLLLISITNILVFFVKKQQSFTLISSIVIVVTGMLGGCFFSMDIAPKYMQVISKLTPESWAIKTLGNTILNGNSLGSQIVPVVVMTGIAIIGLIASAIITNRKLNF